MSSSFSRLAIWASYSRLGTSWNCSKKPSSAGRIRSSRGSGASSPSVSRNRLQDILLDWDRTQLLVSFIVLGLIALSPLVVDSPYYMGIIILTTLYIFTGISWNIVAGFAGQLLIAHIIFLAFGAYTTIVLYNTFGVSPWIGIFAGIFRMGFPTAVKSMGGWMMKNKAFITVSAILNAVLGAFLTYKGFIA